MKSCRCHEIQRLDTGCYNIILKDYRKKVQEKRVYEYTCLNCMTSSYLTEDEVDSRYVINISGLKCSKGILRLEYDEVLNEFYKMDVEPKLYIVYFIMKIIVELLSENENFLKSEKHNFGDIRHETIKLAISEFNEKRLKSTKTFKKRLFEMLEARNV